MRVTTKRAWVRAMALVALLGGTMGCSGLVADAIGAAEDHLPDGQARCRVTASQERPLIIEWPASDRADLELAIRRGLVAVQYSGCEMRLLRRCTAPGGYRYRGTTRELSQDSIRSADELYAKLPLGALSLEGAVERGAELTLSTTVVGQYLADRDRISGPELAGPECAGATHVITGLTAGAFEFFSSRQGAVTAGLELAATRAEAERVLLRRAGDPESCRRSTESDTAPPDNCGALLRVEVRPVECPPGQRPRPGHGCEAEGAGRDHPAEPSRRTGRAVRAPLVRELGTALLRLATADPKAGGWACPPSGPTRTTAPAPRLGRAGDRPTMVASALLVTLRLEPADPADEPGSLEAFWIADARGTTRTVVQRTGAAQPRGEPAAHRGEAWADSAAGPLGLMARDLLDRLSASACELSPPTERDLGSLSLGEQQRERAERLLPSLDARVREACALVRASEGRWILAPDRAGVLVTVGERMLTIEARLRQAQGRLCLAEPTRSWL